MTPFVKVPVVDVHFEMDGLYFTEAVRRSAGLDALQADYDAKRRRNEELNRQIEDIEARHGGDKVAAYDDTEHLVIELVDTAFVRLEDAARPLAGESAAVQLFAAACLEAHINLRAAETLDGAVYDEFERLPLPGKWVLYPQVRELSGLAPGNAVLRDIAILSRRRNGLAHPKRRRVEKTVAFDTPDFVEQMNLTAKDARDACTWTRRAVAALAKAEKRTAPGWLDGGLWSLFRHEWKAP
jgi:hypothetical protein